MGEKGHWCFNHEKYVDHEVVLRTCTPKSHDVDFEDQYKPQTRVKVPQKQTNGDPAMVHAQLVTSIADQMADKTHLIYIQPGDVFYYWNWKQEVWAQYGESFLMKLFNLIAPRIMPNKKRVFSEVIFQLKCDAVTLPRNFEPDRNYIYFSNRALNLEDLLDWPKDKEHNIKICLDTELDLKAPPPLEFIKALKIALPDPFEMIDCLQALSSVLLVRHQRIEKAFFFLGSGGNVQRF